MTETIWARRVEAWRGSGETADVFALGKGFEGSTLRWWSSRLGRASPPGFLRLVPKADAVQVHAEVVRGLATEVGREQAGDRFGRGRRLDAAPHPFDVDDQRVEALAQPRHRRTCAAQQVTQR